MQTEMAKKLATEQERIDVHTVNDTAKDMTVLALPGGKHAGKIRKQLELILSAVSDDPTRYFLNGIYFNGAVVSSDGRRLHALPENTTGIKGLWKTKKDKDGFTLSKLEGQFPNYWKIIPDTDAQVTLDGSGVGGVLSFAAPLIKLGFLFQPDYLTDLIKYSTTWTAHYSETGGAADTKRAVYFETEGAAAVILPLLPND